MKDTTIAKVHKLSPESGVVHEESDAIASIPEGVKNFLDQFEGDSRTAAALLIAATAAQDIQEGDGDLNWATNPEAVMSLAKAQEGLEMVVEIAEGAESFSSLASEVGRNQAD